MGAKIVVAALLLAFIAGAVVMLGGDALRLSYDARLLAGIVTTTSGMLLARPLGSVFQMRRFPYRAEPVLTKLALPNDVPEPARSWVVSTKEAVAALGFELLETFRIDRGSYTFVCLFENAETRTVALVSWHARARIVLYETMIGTRRRVTLTSDSTLDLPLPDDVDASELWTVAPADLLHVHRALVSRNPDADPSSYRSTPSAARVDPSGWMREREIRSIAALVKNGVATVTGERMFFTWAGAIRAVFSTSVPLSIVAAMLRVRRTKKLLAESGIARPTVVGPSADKPVSAARKVLYFAIVLVLLLTIWQALVPAR